MRSFPIVAPICLLASACGPATPTAQNGAQPAAASAEAAANAAIEQDVANIQTNVVRTSETQRLDELERRVGELENKPEKLDLELLSSRVQALEVKAGADGLAATTPSVPGPSPTPTPTRKPAPRPRPSSSSAASADRN